MTKTKKRVLSGVQPTGVAHIGNYLGAFKHWVASQEDFENIFCIVDLHAITVPQDPRKLRNQTRSVAALLLAAGINPNKSTLFVQSHISAHAELAWILNCLTPMGWLQRMTQFKEKAGQDRETVSTGLFTYPTLMAADILLYDVDLVPVGDDQRQHLELTRDLAQRINSLYGPTLVVPEASIPPVAARVMGLDDPTKKMSKSENTPGHAILLLDTPDDIIRKIKRATTDSHRDIVFDPARTGLFNLLSIYQGFTGSTEPEIESRFVGKGYGQLKEDLAETIIETLRPLQNRYHELMKTPSDIDNILADGSERLRPVATKTIERVKAKLGLG
jgi:tryptophanyl-tRNA synthetase